MENQEKLSEFEQQKKDFKERMHKLNQGLVQLKDESGNPAFDDVTRITDEVVRRTKELMEKHRKPDDRETPLNDFAAYHIAANSGGKTDGGEMTVPGNQFDTPDNEIVEIISWAEAELKKLSPKDESQN